MSLMSVETAIDRIKITDPASPLAVFSVGDRLEVSFAKTVKTQERIRTGDLNYLGTFSRAQSRDGLKIQFKNIK